MSELDKEFEKDSGELIAAIESIFDDPDMYIEDRVKVIDEATKKFRDKWGDYTTAEDRASLHKMIGNTEPIVLTKEGPVYFQLSKDRKRVEYGCVCNTGLIVMGSVDYDFSRPAEWNAQEVVNAIIEKFGAVDEG